MDPRTVIESYVDDVVRRLPGRQRADVRFELRSLLGEELDARAEDAGRPADEAMALDLLRGFGAPADVAERYGPAGFLIIRPAAAPTFAWTALIGVAAQWALTLPAALAAQTPAEPLSRFGAWWTSWGVGAFWLPGVMVTFSIVAALVGEHWPRAAGWSPRPPVDRDRISRPLLGVGLVAWAAYMALLLLEPRLADRLPSPLAAAFTFDPDFLRTRALWLFLPWGGQFAVTAIALIEGRWRRRTRHLSAMFGAAVCAVLAWFVVAGPMFVARATDDMTKSILGLIVLISLLSLGVTLYRQRGEGVPKGLASGG